MKLGLVTHKLLRGDGQGRVNYEVAKAALRRGHRVVLVATEVAPELAAAERVQWLKTEVGGWPSALLRNQAFAWHSTQHLKRIQEEVNLVMANGFITWAPTTFNAVHFVHSAWLRSDVHTLRVRRGPRAWYQGLYTALNARWERRAFAQAEALVAVSKRVRDELVEIGVAPDRIHVVPNGVDLDEFSPGLADRAALGLPPDVPLGLFVGDLQTPRKNLDVVLQALRHVPTLHLAVVGETAGSAYPAMAQALGVADRVMFLGFCRDVPGLMRAADLCLCPSRYEPFSLVLLEALASGLPVVTARPVGAADLVTSACGIVLDDPEDAHALAQATSTLIGDTARLQAMGAAARSVAEAHSWARMGQRYVDLFERHVAASPTAHVAA